MNGALVLVADGSRARFFALEHRSTSGATRLVEREDLVDPERQLPGRQLFSNIKSGRNRAPRHGAAHGLDDHRARHRHVVENRFARRIAAAAARQLSDVGCDWLVVAAEPQLLGLLRRHLDASLSSRVRRSELAEDLSRRAVREIRSVLARHGVVPARVTRGGYRQRGLLSPPPEPEPLSPPPRAQREAPGRPRRRRRAAPR